MTKFYRTTFTIEVLSEDQLGDCLSVADIDYAINEGNCVGRFKQSTIEELDGKQTADALLEFGSEPSFFNLDDDGNTPSDEPEVDTALEEGTRYERAFGDRYDS